MPRGSIKCAATNDENPGYDFILKGIADERTKGVRAVRTTEGKASLALLEYARYFVVSRYSSGLRTYPGHRTLPLSGAACAGSDCHMGSDRPLSPPIFLYRLCVTQTWSRFPDRP